MSRAKDIDPEWAWQPWQSSQAEPWSNQKAAHLLRRATFGASRAELRTASESEPAQVVSKLLDDCKESPAYQQQMSTLLSAALATGNPKQLAAWWVYRMLTTPAQLLEKMTLFWHGHFATSAEKVEDADLMNAQNQLLRKYALGCFPDLLLEISQDPAMLIYLDSASNRKAHPNENYAREIMELFCLGEGNYTEKDIRELARCFTGWEVKRQKFRFNRYQHDNDAKTVLGQTGNFGGEQAIAIVAAQPQAATFIARKLVHFFVMDEPVATDELVEPLAKQLTENGFIIGPVVQTILTSNLFYSDHATARKIRSPVEFGIGFSSCLQASTNNFALASRLEELGQGLFYPPSVKGWDGGRTWINSSTLLGRSNLIQELLSSEKSRFAKMPFEEFLSNEGITSCDELMAYFEDLFFAIPIPSAAKDRIRKLTGSSGSSRAFETAAQAICTLPEFQLC